jgi:hypothetical protein
MYLYDQRGGDMTERLRWMSLEGAKKGFGTWKRLESQ